MRGVPDRGPALPLAASMAPPGEHRGDEVTERPEASVEAEGTRAAVRRREVPRSSVRRIARGRAPRPAKPSGASGR